MRDFILRLFINAVALTIVAMIFPSIHFSDNGFTTLILVALLFGLVNAVLKPILFVSCCPLILFTFGLWLFVINGFMLLITDELAGGRFAVDGFWTAVGGGIVISIVSMVLERALGLDNDQDDDGHPGRYRGNMPQIFIMPTPKRDDDSPPESDDD